MALRPSYFVIPVLVFLIALLGHCFTSMGMVWYESEMIHPSLTLPLWVFPIAWNFIFICLAISAIMSWERKFGKLIIGFFIVTGILNVLWSVLFFVFHWILLSFIEAVVVELVIIGLIVLLWDKSKVAAILLFPYAIWVIIADFLIYRTMILNI